MPCRTYAPANSAQAALASAKQGQGAVPSGFSKGGFESTVEGTHAEVGATYCDPPANGTGPAAGAATGEAAVPQQPHAAAAAPGGELSEAARVQAEVVAMARAAAAAAGVVLPPQPAATAPAEEAMLQAPAPQLSPAPAAVPATPKSAAERAAEIAARLAAAGTGIAPAAQPQYEPPPEWAHLHEDPDQMPPASTHQPAPTYPAQSVYQQPPPQQQTYQQQTHQQPSSQYSAAHPEQEPPTKAQLAAGGTSAQGVRGGLSNRFGSSFVSSGSTGGDQSMRATIVAPKRQAAKPIAPPPVPVTQRPLYSRWGARLRADLRAQHKQDDARQTSDWLDTLQCCT